MGMDFDGMLDVCFNTFGADATYLPLSGPTVPITVIISGEDQVNGFQQTRIHSQAMIFEVMKSQIAAPAVGAEILHSGVTYKIKGALLIDDERLIWKLDCYPA